MEPHHNAFYELESYSHRWPKRGEEGGEFPSPQPPISYVATYELFETLLHCVPPLPVATYGYSAGN